jgi:hypothetical protein
MASRSADSNDPSLGSFHSGALAEWLRSGLQSRLHRFDSGRRLWICGGFAKRASNCASSVPPTGLLLFVQSATPTARRRRGLRPGRSSRDGQATGAPVKSQTVESKDSFAAHGLQAFEVKPEVGTRVLDVGDGLSGQVMSCRVRQQPVDE